MSKINHGGTKTQRRSQISDFRFQKTRGKRADLVGKSEVRFQKSEDRGKEGGPLGGGQKLEVRFEKAEG